MICGHGHEQKFKYPYPRDSKIIQMPYPRAKTIDQNPALCPASPPPTPRRLDIDRCIILAWTIILFSLGCDRVWTSAKQTDCKHSTQKINKKILKVLNGQTEPQTSTLIVKIKQVHESHLLQRNTENVWQITEKPQLHVRSWPFKPWKTTGTSEFS